MYLKNKDRDSKSSIINESHTFNLLLETREIFLHPHIDSSSDDDGVDYRMANYFLKNIKLLEHTDKDKPIFIHQYSIGGGWIEGIMIYDLIKSCKNPTVVFTHGIASSMGSVIPMAADLVITMPNCLWLIHEGQSGICNNNMKQAKSWHEWENKVGKQMIDIYTKKCRDSKAFSGKDDMWISSYIQKHLDQKEDWMLSSEEAVNYGFADHVYGESGYSSYKEIENVL